MAVAVVAVVVIGSDGGDALIGVVIGSSGDDALIGK